MFTMYYFHNIPTNIFAAGIPTIYRVILLLEYKCTNVVTCITIVP